MVAFTFAWRKAAWVFIKPMIAETIAIATWFRKRMQWSAKIS